MVYQESHAGNYVVERPKENLWHYSAMTGFLSLVVGSIVGVAFGSSAEHALGYLSLTTLVITISVGVLAAMRIFVTKRGNYEILFFFLGSTLLGAIAGLTIFSWNNYKWFGLVICIPISLITCAIGIGVDAFLTRILSNPKALGIAGLFIIVPSVVWWIGTVVYSLIP